MALVTIGDMILTEATGGVTPSVCSAIASSYAESAASGKQDTLTFAYDADSAISAINGSALAGGGGVVTSTASGEYYDYRTGQLGYYTGIRSANESALIANFATISDYARFDPDRRELSSLVTKAYVDSSVSSKQDSSAMSAYALSADVSGCIDTVSSNSASWGGGGATGDYVERSAQQVAIGSSVVASGAGALAQGTQCTASGAAFAQGYQCSAYYNSMSVGQGNTANWMSVAFPYSNSASDTAIAIGTASRAKFASVSLGPNNSALSYSHALGGGNSASGTSVSIGNSNSAKSWGFAGGRGNIAVNSATVFGHYNLHKDGDASTGESAAFVIGDGTGVNSRHDLMLVTRNGEITMYSSTADTTGVGVVSSIRALSASVGNVTALLDAI